MLSNSEFLRLASSARQNSLEEFTATISETPQFATFVEKINDISQKWGKTVGIGAEKEKKAEAGLTDKEKKWKQFFRDHTWNSTEEQRTFADAFSIAEGIDLRRFLVVSKPGRSKFSPLVCIVPTGNDNGHDYRIGAPIICLSQGDRFYKLTGTPGNSMTPSTNMYRIATPDEIATLIMSIMYRAGSMAEFFVDFIINRDGE